MHSPQNWELHIDPDVVKVLQKFPRYDTVRILDVIRLLPVDPYFGDIQKMKGYNDVWRRRIGSYRIFFRVKIEARIILVFNVERRTSSTY